MEDMENKAVMMAFDKNELNLLDVAYQASAGRAHGFDVFSNEKWRKAGIQNWIQTELIVALVDKGYEVSIDEKVRHDVDIVVKNGKSGDMGVEIGSITAPVKRFLIDRELEKHRHASLFLFIFRSDEKITSELYGYFEKRGYIEQHRTLTGSWLVMLVKKLNKEKNRKKTAGQ